MVSHLPLRGGGSASRAPFRVSYCIIAYPLVSPPRSMYACNTRARVAQSIYYELYGTHRVRARRSTLRPTIPPRGTSTMATVLFPVNYLEPRAHARMHARTCKAAIFTLPRKLVSASKSTWPAISAGESEKRNPRELHSRPIACSPICSRNRK